MAKKRRGGKECGSGSAPAPSTTHVTPVLKPAEMLLIGSSSSDPFSTIIIDPRTGVSSWSYKGSELQGAIPGIVQPLGRNGDHLMITIKDRPLAHVVGVHNRDKFHQKTVLSGVVTSFCTTSDASLLFVAIRTQILTFALSTGELISVCDAHHQSLTCIGLSDDESLLVSTSLDGAINVYLVVDLMSSSGDMSIVPLRQWRAHSLAIRSLVIGHGANPRIYTTGLDHTACVYSISLDACLLRISADRPLCACAIDPAETRLFVATDLGNIAQINLYSVTKEEMMIATGDEHNSGVPVFNGHTEEVCRLAVNGDGTQLVSGDTTGKYCIWDIASRQCLKVSTMRGSISSLQFIGNWASIGTAETVVALRPSLQLQKAPSDGLLIPIAPKGRVKDQYLLDWHNTIDEQIERILMTDKAADSAEPMFSSPQATLDEMLESPGKPETIESEPDVVCIDDQNDNETTDTNADKETIRKLNEEVIRLKKVNASMYQFAAREILKSGE